MSSFATQLWVLAGNTLRELVRSKLLYNLLIFAILLIGSSSFVAQLTIGQWDRIILDMGLAATQIVGLLLAVLIGVGLVAGEIDRRTIYPTLARPLSRGTFLLGRYLGLLLVLAINVLVMLGVLALVLHLAGYELSRTAAEAVFLIFIELSVLAAAALLFGSFTTPMLAAAFSFSVFLIGHLLGDLRAFGERSHSEAAKIATGIAYRLLPDLSLLDLKAQAASELSVESHAVVTGAVYGLCYAAVLLSFAVLVFRRRDLK
jgi:ABC-type transport system involved in multi-copper enzyme maturation permease subunit